MTRHRLMPTLALLTVLTLAACSTSAPSSAGASAGSGASSATQATERGGLRSFHRPAERRPPRPTRTGDASGTPCRPTSRPIPERRRPRRPRPVRHRPTSSSPVATPGRSRPRCRPRSTAAGYTTDGLSGPLEDGSFTLDMTGPPAGCKVQLAGDADRRPDEPSRSCTGPPARTADRSLSPSALAGGASRATQPHRPRVYPAANRRTDPVRLSLGEARSCRRLIRGTSERSRWSLRSSWSSSSSA